MSRAYRATMVAVLALTILATPGLISLTNAEPPEKVPPDPVRQAPAASEKAPPRTGTADIRLLGVNDFHGNLEPPYAVDGTKTGGAAYLDRQERAAPGGVIRVHAGDMVGGSPLPSSYFHDEPTIYAMNEMGFDVGTLGNHEFDEGGEEMLRLINGGQRNDGLQFKDDVDGTPVNTSDPDFTGAEYPYVAANTLYRDSDEPALPPYKIVERDGVRVGFIGVTTSSTPEIVMPDAVAPFRFTDISETVNRYAGELQQRGVETIVVLAHAGGYQSGPERATGEILAETARMNDAVDVVFAGHTHNRLNARVGSKLVVEANKYGTALSVNDLKVDRATGEASGATAEVLPVRGTRIVPDPEVAALVERYAESVEPLAGRVIGTAAENVTLSSTAAGESSLGDFIADAQRDFAGADLAFVAPGGIRTDIKAGPVTYGELFAVQPFGDRVVKMEMTGEQIYRVLEWEYTKEGSPLQVSGLRFAYDSSKPPGQRVTSATLADGSPLEREALYTVAVKGFLAGSGDQRHFTEGRNARTVGTDIEALVEHVRSMPQPFTAPDPAEDPRMMLER